MNRKSMFYSWYYSDEDENIYYENPHQDPRDEICSDNEAVESIYDLSELLSSDKRDFLIRSTGEQVKISSLVGKIVGIFSCTYNTICSGKNDTINKLIEAYREIKSSPFGGDFEVVSVDPVYTGVVFSGDFLEVVHRDEIFNIPWLAVPHRDCQATYKRLKQSFIRCSFDLAFIDSTGKVLMQYDEAISSIKNFGADAYPFTRERIELLEEQEAKSMSKMNQSQSSLLVHQDLDYLIMNNGDMVSVSKVVDKTVGFYFSVCNRRHLSDAEVVFRALLSDVYNELVAEKGENFEVVLVHFDNVIRDNVEDFRRGHEAMPWMALPYKDKRRKWLFHYFSDGNSCPMFAVMGPHGMTVNCDATELLEEHGAAAFPFTPERIEELQKSKLGPHSIDSLLTFMGRDFVTGKDGIKVPVAQLVGKTTLLFFAGICEHKFLEKLIKAYYDIKVKETDFEVIFIQIGSVENTSNQCLSKMPWFTILIDDFRSKRLYHWFKPEYPDTAIVLDDDCQIVTREAVGLINAYGPDAYPFTKEHLEKLQVAQMAEL